MTTGARKWSVALHEELGRQGLSPSSGRHPHPGFTSQRLHLAIFVEPYLSLILDGLKTIESRFSMYRLAPFDKVARGDWILLKHSGGPIVGMCDVSTVRYLDGAAIDAAAISRRYARATCMEERELRARLRSARYVTFLGIKRVRELEPFECGKRDRRGWVVVEPISATAHR
ncbi:MAG: ASCH domain-containing protein [Actinomycetota bacterium]